jgi:hypothetical protein
MNSEATSVVFDCTIYAQAMRRKRLAMSGHRNFDELRNRMSPERRAHKEKRVEEDLRNMLISSLRRAAARTQAEMVDEIGVQRSNEFDNEAQDDMQISTLRRIIEALGGRLEIIADLPGGERVALNQFI